MSEFSWIRRYFAPLAAGYAPAAGLTDDAAFLLPPAGLTQVITVDAMVAGVHFFPSDPADLIARKLLRVNLSDLAAKGAAPECYFLACSLPKKTDEAWIARFCHGLAADQVAYGIHLAGGDTTATDGPLTLSLTLLGYAKQPVTRSGAAVGDDIYLSGTVGDAYLGLQRLLGALDVWDGADEAVTRYHLPQPRTTLGLALPAFATAAMDVSDGLLADLTHLCSASGCGAEVALESIPLSFSVQNACTTHGLNKQEIISRGDDYELLFTAPAAARQAVMDAADKAGTPVTRIGCITPSEGVRLLDADGAEITLRARGFDHFTGS